MDHARHHFLAHAAFAADEYRNVHRRDLQNLLADLQHLRAGGEERKIFGERFAIFAQRLIFGAQLLLLAALQKCGVEFRLFERLGEVIERADANRFDHGGDFVRAGKHDDVERAVHLHQLPQRLEAVHLRHQHVQNDEIRALARTDALEGFLAAGHRFHVEAVHFQQRLEILSNARFVVHYQNFFFVSHLSS